MYDEIMSTPLQSRYYDENELKVLGIKSVGRNVLVSEHATLVGLGNISLGSNVRIDSHVVILAARGILGIGNNVHIEPSASIVAHFPVQIGNFCTISHGVRLFTASADYSGNHFTNVFPSKNYQDPLTGPITIMDHVIIGGNSVVMPNLVISEGAAIGALSFVKNSLEGWTIYGGNPLRTIKTRSKGVLDLAREIESNVNLKSER
jgi:acetyltransferase-like isoleucine patch superfamily enzyme